MMIMHRTCSPKHTHTHTHTHTPQQEKSRRDELNREKDKLQGQVGGVVCAACCAAAWRCVTRLWRNSTCRLQGKV
jgi:hypothetical protein